MRNNQDPEKENVAIPSTPPPSSCIQTIRMANDHKVRGSKINK